MTDRPEASRTSRERLVDEQKEAWAKVSGLLRAVREAYAAEAGREGLGATQSIEEAIAIYEQKGRALLADSLEELERTRPIRQSLNAIEDFDREGGESALRDVVSRARIDGAMQVVLGRALLSLNVPWLLWLGGGNAVERTARWARWCALLENCEKEAGGVLTRYADWAGRAEKQQGTAPESLRRKHERHLAFWWRRQRSVAGNLALAGGVWRAGLGLLRLARSMSERIELERGDLLNALRNQVRYLEDWRGGRFDPPAIEARIKTREERGEEWWTHCNAILEEQLPQAMECFAPPMALPTIFDRPRRLAPIRVFQEALREAARGVFQRQFAAVMEGHLGIAKEIERAGEVIRYAAEASRAAEVDLLPEAIKNVVDRLRERGEGEVSLKQSLAMTVLPAIVRATKEAGESAGTKLASEVAMRTRRRSAALLREGRAGAAGQAETAAARISSAVVEYYDDFLIRVGWRTPVRVPVPPVETRPDLEQALKIDVVHRDLPALYLRLFRLAPVDDPRFLVGREEELDGFRQALAAWHAGRYAACLVVGARGSGKTSLLNCAMPEVFAGETVVRGQFRGRIESQEELDRFLLQLAGAEEQNDLTAVLESTRRVVVLEEVERVFLKRFGGFEAARRLLEIMQGSASSTLWILVMNTHAARLLERAVQWQGYFSHTVNSMSVWREDLERAILQRHNLSGLKLAFAPTRQGGGLRKRIGVEIDPQESFFDALYEQSGGNFRSAFELWQSSVERVEGGTIHMQQPLSPELGRLRKQMRQEDHFTLLSILQHGSLTPEELSQVLREPEKLSGMRLKRLAALGLVEPDPEYPGLRVDPEAQRFVHGLLQGVNLV